MNKFTTIFDVLRDVQWNEEPFLTLSEWRVRLPCSTNRCVDSVQVEFLNTGRGAIMIVSLWVDGKQTEEGFLLPKQVKQLRTLLINSDMTEEEDSGKVRDTEAQQKTEAKEEDAEVGQG